MSQLKIVSIIGSRPQFIKYHAVSRHMESFGFEDILIHTGQHYDYNMSDIFFEKLNIKHPDYYLNIHDNNNAKQILDTSILLRPILHAINPDIVMVYGDTNATIAGSLAASSNDIPIVHIEAGLRSHNLQMTEESNRIVTDSLSDMLFCPSEHAVNNLRTENIIENIYNVGDVMYDVLKLFDIKQPHNITNPYNFMTLHRAETVNNKTTLRDIIEFCVDISDNKDIIFPVHPRTAVKIIDYHIRIPNNIIMCDPFSYDTALCYIQYADIVLTDSGGIQKEAYWLYTPCITLRRETEWHETIDTGWNVLYGDYNSKHNLGKHIDIYGDGTAAQQILSIIKQTYQEKK
jgi:UDP-GlcNAc3NAcA epimerase